MSGGILAQIADFTTDILKARAVNKRDDYPRVIEGESLVHKDMISAYQGRGLGTGNALLFDPNLWGFSSMAYREKPYALNYYVLNQLGERDAIIAAIVLTRLNQISAFTYPKSNDEASRTIGTGYRVQMKKGNNKKYTKATEKREDYFNTLLEKCSDDKTPVGERVERSFDTFLRRFTQDRLILDQAVSLIEKDDKNNFRQFYAVDGSTFRLTAFGSDLYNKYGPYIQVFNGMVIGAFQDANIVWGAQNLTTQLARFGYGRSELEFLVRLLMAHLGIDASNEKMFNPHSMPKGFLTAEMMEVSEDNMRALELSWANQLTMSRSRHRIPILGLPKGGKISFQSLPQATDLEFGRFIDYFTNVACSVYQMDPVEINFQNRGGVGQKQSALGGSSDWEARLTASKDRGLRGILAWLARVVNQEIMPELDPDEEFEFSWVGFDAKSDKERTDLAKEQASTFKTVDEVREEFGLDKLGEDLGGNMILNQVYTSRIQMLEQQKQMEEQQAQQQEMQAQQGGMPGQEQSGLDSSGEVPQNEDQSGGESLWRQWAQQGQEEGQEPGW